MAFPTVVARTSYVSSTTNAASWTPFSAATVAVGELLVFVCSADGGEGGTQKSTSRLRTFSAGWTMLTSITDGAFITSVIFIKQATSTSESLTIECTDSSEQYSGILYRITGADTVSATGTTSAGFSTTNANPPSHSASASADHLWIAAATFDSTTVATAAPSGYSNLTTRAAGGTAGVSTCTADKTAASQTDDPATFTSAAQRWAAWTIAVSQSTGSLATVTYVGAGTAVAGTGTISVGLPAGYQAGDLLILAAEKSGGSITAPSGWNSAASTSGGDVYYKIATASESAVSVVVPSSNNHLYGAMFAFRGVHQTFPVPVDTDSLVTGTNSLALPTVTTTLDACMIAYLLMGQADAAGARIVSQTNASLTSLTKQFDDGTDTGDGGGIALITGTKTTAGSTSGGTFSGTPSQTYYTFTLALAPGRVAGGSTRKAIRFTYLLG